MRYLIGILIFMSLILTSCVQFEDVEFNDILHNLPDIDAIEILKNSNISAKRR